MRRILFVDDESRILAGLARMLHTLRNEWEMVFAEGGREALARCESAPFDVVVSDARMPGMQGAELLREIMNRYPDTVRMILSGQCSRDAAIQCLGVAHQFLSKPCDPRLLKETLHRTCNMRERFGSEMIRKVISRTPCLSSRKAAYTEFVEQVKAPVPRIDRLAEIVARDVAMSVKVLQLVSSGFFGNPQQQTTDAGQATKLLGVDTLKALVDSPAAFQLADPGLCPEEDLILFNEHSVAVALVAEELARTVFEDRRQIEEAYLAGMLHGMGALALVGHVPTSSHDTDTSAGHGETSDANAILTLAEFSPHASGYLAALWGLPPRLVEAVGYYRMPRLCPSQALGPLTILHVAHAVVEQFDGPAHTGVCDVDLDYLKSLGCADRLPQWRDICRNYRPEGVLS